MPHFSSTQGVMSAPFLWDRISLSRLHVRRAQISGEGKDQECSIVRHLADFQRWPVEVAGS
jgi:hypothetical protein